MPVSYRAWLMGTTSYMTIYEKYGRLNGYVRNT